MVSVTLNRGAKPLEGEKQLLARLRTRIFARQIVEQVPPVIGTAPEHGIAPYVSPTDDAGSISAAWCFYDTKWQSVMVREN